MSALVSGLPADWMILFDPNVSGVGRRTLARRLPCNRRATGEAYHTTALLDEHFDPTPSSAQDCLLPPKEKDSAGVMDFPVFR